MKLKILALASILLLGLSSSLAQRATEMYIPIGQSPGLSGKYTSIGTIKDVDVVNRVLSCTYQGGTFSLKVTDRSMIWTDRSKLKLPNQKCSFSECAIGRTIEVKYVNTDQPGSGEAEWIKVQVPEGK
jgi:hypothetical protein